MVPGLKERLLGLINDSAYSNVLENTSYIFTNKNFINLII